MRAILRWMTILLAGGLCLAPASALAQETTQPATSNTPAPAAVGPSELQNFSLRGNVTKPSDQQAQPTVIAPPTASRSEQPAISSPARPRRTAQIRPQAPEATISAPASAPAPVTQSATQPTTSSNVPLQPGPSRVTNSQPRVPESTLAPQHKISILPWIIAAIAVAGGAIFLLWRRRPREAFAGGSEIDLYVAPEPAPTPAPEPLPPPATKAPGRAVPAASGIVASRLRPSLELGIQPLRCLVEDGQVTIEFEVELFNAGTAPARAVLAEASMLNAGATQDQELAAFFANPVGAGERLDAIAPMRRISLTSKVVAPRAAIQEYELAGRKAFVPVLAFNALYEWSGGKGQTSAAYLVGRETSSDKLGPLRLESAPREFSSLAAHELPTALRT